MKRLAMRRWISGMLIVSSLVFLMAVVGGVQKDTIDIIPSFFYILGTFFWFLAGFVLLCRGEK